MKHLTIKSGSKALLLMSMFSSITGLKAQNTNIFPLNGSVGIGTTTPVPALEILKPMAAAVKIRNNTAVTTADGSVIFEMVNAASNSWKMTVGGKNNVSGLSAGQFYIERSGLGASFLINQTGKVGFGNLSPVAQVDVASNEYLVARFMNINTASNTDGTAVVDISNSAGTSWRIATAGKNNGLAIPANQFYIEKTGYGACLSISPVGNVLINKITQTNTTYKLEVGGKIRANEIVVNTTGADFVFATDYKLHTLKELELFVKINKHLPGIATAAEMTEQGVEVGELSKTLLQKIEELTLYIIEQQKQIDALKAETENKK